MFDSPVLMHSFHLFKEIIPVFFFAIIAASVLDEFLPDDYLEKFFKEANFVSILNSSILGALIPICTCGMIPLAMKLFQKGLNWKIITSFLVSGTACSIPALWLTTVLGYKVVSLRFVTAVAFGILVTYILALMAPKNFTLKLDPSLLGPNDHGCCDASALGEKPHQFTKHLRKIWDDLVTMCLSFLPWLLFAILIAGFLHHWIVNPFENPIFMKYLGMFTDGHVVASAVSPVIAAWLGFPFYFCAGADVPISQELAQVGIPLGTIIAFMTAAPGVNLTTFVVYRKCIGTSKALLLTLVSAAVATVIGIGINYSLL